jgi:MFS family permease
MGTLGDVRRRVGARGVRADRQVADRGAGAAGRRRGDARAVDAVAVAVGVWISAFSAGNAVGPVLGGVLPEQFWWGSVFLLAVPVMALLLAVVRSCRRSTATRTRAG